MVRCLVFLALLCLLLKPALAASAEESVIAIFSLSQGDYDGDGAPDLTTLDCAFATGHDLVHVLDQGGDMPLASDWQTATDFENDTWLYDIGADGSIQLIVVYRMEQGLPVAYIYDDRDGDGQVRFSQDGTLINVLESPYWTARLTTPSAWYLPDGRPNLNVQMELDGVASMGAMPEYVRERWIMQDGAADLAFENVAGADGIARYAVQRLLADVPYYYLFNRSNIWSNVSRVESLPYPRAFFLYLPVQNFPGDPALSDHQYFDRTPFVAVDWTSGVVENIGLAGYTDGHGWFCYNNSYLEKGVVNTPSMECPQAQYDLADNRDGIPELNLRMFYSPIGDLRIQSSIDRADIPYEEIFYSWNQTRLGGLNWEFKVGLAGNYSIDEVIEFPDFALKQVPFEQFPFWVAERPWKLTTFVAVENGRVSGSEGIWAWNPMGAPGGSDLAIEIPAYQKLVRRYMIGLDTSSPDLYYTKIEQGLRGERNFQNPALPRLYLSPVDHKLHLRGAQFGVWNIDDLSTVEYRDLDADGYLDEWLYLEQGQVLRRLNLAPGFLLVGGDSTIALRQADVPLSMFETPPPRDHADWLRLGEQLSARQPTFAPTDFAAMLAQFGSPDLQVSRASLRDFRSIGKGFRFVLELQPGFTLQGFDLLQLASLTPGAYVVEYDSAWHVASLTPPALRMEPAPASADALPAVALQPGEAAFQVSNEGLEDAPEVVVRFTASRSGEVVYTSQPVTVTVLGGGVTPVSFPWTPSEAGEWGLEVQAQWLDQSTDQLKEASTMRKTLIAPAEEPTFIQSLTALGLLETRQIVLLMLAVGMFASVSAWLFYRTTVRELVSQPEPIERGKQHGKS